MAKIIVVVIFSCLMSTARPQFPFLPIPSIPILTNNPITAAINNIASAATSGDLQQAVGQTLQTTTGLLNTVTSAIAPTNVLTGLVGALLPQNNALTSLTNQLTGTNAASCLTGVSNSFTSLTNGGVQNFLNCVKPLANQATLYQQSVFNISTQFGELIKTSITKTWNCVANSFSRVDFAQTINCFTIAFLDLAEFAKATSQTIQNLFTESRNMVLQLPSCATKTLLSATQSTNALIQNVIACASGKGVQVTTQSIPLVPDLTNIVNTGVGALEKATSVLTGTNNPLLSVGNILNTVKQTTSGAQSTIGQAIAPAMSIIDKAVTAVTGSVASSNPDLKVCIATAQTASIKILPNATANTVKCTTGVTAKAAAFTAEMTTLTTAINAKIASGSAATLAKCSWTAIAFNPGNMIQCFQTALSEFNGFVDTSIAKGQKLFESTTDLLAESTNCVGSGAELAVRAADEVVTTMTDCLRGKGFNVANILG